MISNYTAKEKRFNLRKDLKSGNKEAWQGGREDKQEQTMVGTGGLETDQGFAEADATQTKKHSEVLLSKSNIMPFIN